MGLSSHKGQTFMDDDIVVHAVANFFETVCEILYNLLMSDA